MKTLGSIQSLHRYPVKSMLGEVMPQGAVSSRGIEGDRTHALLDVVSGKIASAKKPWLWHKLLKCSARVESDSRERSRPAVQIVLPGGEALRSDDDGVDQALSSFLQRQVRLISEVPQEAEVERADPDAVLAGGITRDVAFTVFKLGRAAPATTFVDFGPVHLITTATLAEISRVAGQDIEPLRYRPNVIIDSPGIPPFSENQWVGQTLELGSAVKLQVIIATPRCAVPTLSHGDLPGRPEALQTVMRLNRVEIAAGVKLPCVGVHARVLSAGLVRCGDEVRLLETECDVRAHRPAGDIRTP